MNVAGISAQALSGTQFGADASRGVAAAAQPGVQGASFEQTLGQVFTNAMSSVQNGEATAIQGLQGDVAPFKVVEAVMGAQRTLQAALAMRDKAVSAYQEVTRMAI